MDEGMHLFELENDAEHVLLARNQRNGNREALTALRKRTQATKTSIKSLFESIMKDIGNSRSRVAPLMKGICGTCGYHDEKRKNLDDVFQEVMLLLLFHFMQPTLSWRKIFSPLFLFKLGNVEHEEFLEYMVARNLDLEHANYCKLEYDAKTLQGLAKEKYLLISGRGVHAESISPGVLRSFLTDKPYICPLNDSRCLLRALNPNFPVPASVYSILGHYSAFRKSSFSGLVTEDNIDDEICLKFSSQDSRRSVSDE
ncbi:hypothetical protein SADUNF_Sadunf14G0037000 [Salix dunnii]|uniref:Uncharacterized protein n=1 Tax=Salix dunnii TaxID=1413687 RepID=A0A835JDX9_9ROSI|nr:hypothetical protein SADUNF_Sadunf14G0037000 [Salix dunnii]